MLTVISYKLFIFVFCLKINKFILLLPNLGMSDLQAVELCYAICRDGREAGNSGAVQTGTKTDAKAQGTEKHGDSCLWWWWWQGSSGCI